MRFSKHDNSFVIGFKTALGVGKDLPKAYSPNPFRWEGHSSTKNPERKTSDVSTPDQLSTLP